MAAVRPPLRRVPAGSDSPCGRALAACERRKSMCGYACVNCGRCRGEVSAFASSMDKVPGYCAACGTLNGPSAKTCSTCGAVVDAASVAKKAQDDFLGRE